MDNIWSGGLEKHVCMLSYIPKCIDLPPTAGWRGRLHCMVRWAVSPAAWHAGTQRFVRSPLRLRAECERSRVRLHPYSPFVFAWHLAHLLVTQSMLVYMPFQVFIICPDQYDPFILAADVMSALSMLVMFFTGYVDERNQMIVMDPTLINVHYLWSTFVFDLIACLPLQLIAPLDDCQYPTHTAMLFFKLFRLKSMSTDWDYALDHFGISFIKRQIATVIINDCLFLHWMAFFHYQVPMFTIQMHPAEDRGELFKKFSKLNDIWDLDLSHKYTAHLFIVSRMCIGVGSMSAVDEHDQSDMVVSAFMGLLGLIVMCYSFTILMRLIIYAQSNRNIFNGRLNELNKYMAFKRLPLFLQEKIHLFLYYKYNGNFYSEQCIMNTINEQIKHDINMYSCKQLISNIPLFQDMPVALTNAIIFSLTCVLYMPGEVLVRSDEPRTALFVISSGAVVVLNSKGKELMHLRDGAYFGETALIRPEATRNSTVVAIEMTEAYRLDSSAFQACLQPYPQMQRRLERSYDTRRSSES